MFICSFSTFFQTQFNPQIEGDMVKATYAGGDLTTILGKDLIYPVTSSANGTVGNVLFILTIDENGNLVSVETKERISDELVSQSQEAINRLIGKWTPTKINGKTVSREYLLVFSYKIFYNSIPMDYFATATKYEEKGKLKKAIGTYDDAIEDNPYEPTYYKMRASLKKANHQEEGGIKDDFWAEKMRMEVVALIQIAQTQPIR